ncbi:MAG: hypothetical protein K0U68_12915 [Gammaproteobacteria bacterium]|nr:hypothetical protein [Gammaproteobacteria bacterium]
MKKTRKQQVSQLDQLPEEATRRGEDNEIRVGKALDVYGDQHTWPFNSKQRKVVQAHLMEELAQGFEHRRKALDMALETRLHSIREACNHVLVTGKTHLRQQRVEYFGDVYRDVEQRMNNLADEFLTDMDQRFEHMKEYKSEVIRQREHQRLERSVENFLETMDVLMTEFRNIINEHIDHQGGTH